MYFRHSYMYFSIVPCGGERCGFSLKLKAILRFFKCMESMARDMRHPYIPSTTVLGDNITVCAAPIEKCVARNNRHLHGC